MGTVGDAEGEGAGILSPETETETTETCARCRVSWQKGDGKVFEDVKK